MRNYSIKFLCNAQNTKHLFTMFLLFSATFLFSQRTVSGVITDEDGLGLPGVSIIETGTTNGTITDLDGNYSVTVSGEAASLTYSFVGYAPQTILVGNQSTITMSLAPDAALLDEVVVTGYSTQTRGDLTGAVASVDLDEANKAPIVNVAEALEGRVSGVTIVNNGNPGAAPTVRIRGLGTVNNNNPLYIIDGVQTTDGSILNSINPNDVAQINVLKDGAASIYGARASNGVIIITTKSGSYNQDKASFSFNAYTGTASAINLPELLNPTQLGNVLFESNTNDGQDFNHTQFGSGTPSVPAEIVGPSVPAIVAPGGTDWLDAIFQDAPTQNVDFTVSNGSENSKFSFSAGFLNREGIQLTTGFQRGLLRLNSEHKVANRFTVGQHLNVSFSNSSFGNSVQTALRSNPLIPIRDSEGEFAGTFSAASQLGNATNPVADLTRLDDDFFKQTRLVGDVFLAVDIVDGLKFKTSFGGDLNSFNDRRFLARNPEHSEPRPTNSLTEQNQNFTNWTWTNTLNYIKGFDKHTINVLVGTEAVMGAGKGAQTTVTGFLLETPEFYTLTTGSGTPVVDFAFDFENALSSIFASANYQYDNKYFVTATVRNDNSSNFAPENTGDIFPSISAGWVISNEDFFNDNGILDYLKLKGSWGQLGNQNVPTGNPSLSISGLSIANANYPFNGQLSTGAILQSVGNPNLTWETSTTSNFGIELGLFNSNLTFSAEYFRIETQDLIAQDFSIINDLSIDAAAPFVNIGAVENTGFDFSLGYGDQTDGGFSWGIDANLSLFTNEVTELASAFQVGDGIPFAGTSANRTQVGQPIASFFGRVVEGIYRTEGEVAAGPDQGFTDAADGVGRFRYADLNNDGVIDDDDRTFIGSPHADFSYGVNLSAGYKGFDLSAFVSGVVGNEIYNGDRVFTDFPTFPNGNRSVRVLDAFNSATNPNGNAPALSTTITNAEIQANSFFVEDGSFLRLKNLQLGYTLPKSLFGNVAIEQVRFYVSASNLLTITDYSGIDPEISPSNGASALTLGLDVNNFPLSRIVLFGVNIKL